MAISTDYGCDSILKGIWKYCENIVLSKVNILLKVDADTTSPKGCSFCLPIFSMATSPTCSVGLRGEYFLVVYVDTELCHTLDNTFRR